MKQISWLLPCLFLVACGHLSNLSAQDVRNNFNPHLGQSYDMLIKELGPPTSCSALSTGDKVCEWDRSYNSYSEGRGGTVDRRYHFVINNQGTVTEWRWRGKIQPFYFWEYVNLSSKDSLETAPP